MTRPLKSSQRRPTFIHLICAATLFSLLVFALQSVFFTGTTTKIINAEDVQILSDFQSDVQQCVANRGFGLTAHIIDHCKLILKFPEGTNSTWLNPQFKTYEPLEYKYDVCEEILLWEQYRNMTTVLTREYLDAWPDVWMDYAAKRIAQLGAKDCSNRTLCEEHLNPILQAKPPFHPRQFHKCAVVGNSGDLLKTEFGEEIDSHDAVIRDNEGPVNEVTSANLHCHFHALGAGVIEDVRIQRDKGFGFIRYSSHAEAARAIQLENTRYLYGKPLKCSWGSNPTPPGSSSTPLPLLITGSNLGFPAMDIAAYERQMALSKMAGMMHQQMGGAASQGYPGIAATQIPMYYQ